MNLVLFTDEESELIFNTLYLIKKEGRDKDVKRIEENINSLLDLIQSISHYPSILKSDTLCNFTRSVDTLMDVLCENEGHDKIMYIPTKAVLGKGFLLAKISFLNMLKLISNDIPTLQDKIMPLNKIITDTIYTVMIEEVFLCIVEDKDLDEMIRNRAGFLLANIWEYQLTEGVKEFAPILNSMWLARKKLIPIYGTMMGTQELMQFSGEVDPLLIDFISDDETSEDAFQAVEEFLFTLTYEDITKLRQKMKEMSLNVVNREKVKELIDKEYMKDNFSSADSREMYRFFKTRKADAKFRKRGEMDGPRKTIEEHIMCFLLNSNRWIPY